MKRKQNTYTQIITGLKQYEGGRDVYDVCREYGIHRATFYNWRYIFHSMETSQLKVLNTLQEDN